MVDIINHLHSILKLYLQEILNHKQFIFLPIDNYIDEEEDGLYSIQVQLAGQEAKSLGSITIIDNDIAGISLLNNTCTDTLIENTHLNCEFLVSLTSQPINNTTVNLIIGGGDPRVVFSTNNTPTHNLIFTPDNWSRNQLMRINIKNNYIDEVEYNHITMSAYALDYTTLRPSFSFVVKDDDISRIILTPTGSTPCIGTLREGTHTNCTFNTILTAQPANDVVVTFSLDNSLPHSFNITAPNSITFNAD